MEEEEEEALSLLFYLVLEFGACLDSSSSFSWRVREDCVTA